jgi:hypothetical protein
MHDLRALALTDGVDPPELSALRTMTWSGETKGWSIPLEVGVDGATGLGGVVNSREVWVDVGVTGAIFCCGLHFAGGVTGVVGGLDTWLN